MKRWRKWNPCAVMVRIQNGGAAVKMEWEFLKKLNRAWPHALTTPLPGTYPRELKARPPAGICRPMFTAVLLTTAKGRRNSSIQQEWRDKQNGAYTYSVERYTKQNKPVSPKDKPHTILFILVPRVVLFMETESRMVVTRGWAEEEGGVTSQVCSFSSARWREF